MKTYALVLAPVVLLAGLSQEANAQRETRTKSSSETTTVRDSMYLAPRTSTEKSLAELWSQVLRVERVGMLDRFYPLGGHSLTATELALRIESTFDVRMEPKFLLENPSVEETAKAIDRQRLSR
ncbi:MAG TPA: phosphopantetheine-binding protein [Longimicrobiaceae bacterium]|nr:phosphopantetheine-binding protein [Longimicrobiaceae bacterium]